jgi:hypothetical protein
MSDWYPINREEQERCAGILAHTHVPLPLDASAVTDAVVERVATAIKAEYTDIVLQNREDTPMSTLLARAAIAALAQALGEEQ